MSPPDKITAQQVHRIYCACGGANNDDAAAATAYNEARALTQKRFAEGLYHLAQSTFKPGE